MFICTKRMTLLLIILLLLIIIIIIIIIIIVRINFIRFTVCTIITRIRIVFDLFTCFLKCKNYRYCANSLTN